MSEQDAVAPPQERLENEPSHPLARCSKARNRPSASDTHHPSRYSYHKRRFAFSSLSQTQVIVQVKTCFRFSSTTSRLGPTQAGFLQSAPYPRQLLFLVLFEEFSGREEVR